MASGSTEGNDIMSDEPVEVNEDDADGFGDKDEDDSYDATDDQEDTEG